MNALLFILVLPLLVSGLLFGIYPLRFKYILSLAVSAVHLLVMYLLMLGVLPVPESRWFIFDALSLWILLIVSHVYFWVVLISYEFLQRPAEGRMTLSRRLYFNLLNLYLFSASLAVISNHLGAYWVAVETTTLSLAPLIIFFRSPSSIEAMWKYLFIVSIGLAFAFIGIIFLTLSAYGGSLEGEDLFLTVFTQYGDQLNPVWLKAGFIFLFVGLSTKIGIAPMHPGDVDATSMAPGPVGALMAGSLRAVGLIGVLRIFQIMLHTPTAPFAKTILIIGGCLSLMIAMIFMFKTTSYKRLIAYSSVEHLGLIVIGIGTGGLALIGAMLHLFYNSLVKMALFLSAGLIHSHYQSGEVRAAVNVLTQLPRAGWLFLFSFFGVCAMPPFGLFFSEIRIFLGLIEMQRYILLGAILFFLLFVFIGSGRSVFRMLYSKPAPDINDRPTEKTNLTHIAIIAILALLVLTGCCLPESVETIIRQIAVIFGDVS